MKLDFHLPDRYMWAYDVLIDETDLFAKPHAVKFHRESALESLRRAVDQLRFPTVSRPFYVRINGQHIRRLEPYGSTKRDRWRSLVVQLRTMLLKEYVREESRYRPEYLATHYSWSCTYWFSVPANILA